MWMARKYVLCLLCVVISCAGQPTNSEYNYAPGHEYASKDYSFSYGVKDMHTGDIKHQWEKKTGDVVRGRYSLVEPDGSMRIVDYTADGKHGFNAVVKHKGISHHPTSKKPTSYSQISLQNKEKLTQIADYLKEASGLGSPEETHEEVYNHAYLAIEENEDQNHEVQYEQPQDDSKNQVYTYVPHEDGEESESIVQANHRQVYVYSKEEPDTKVYDSYEEKPNRNEAKIQTYQPSDQISTNLKVTHVQKHQPSHLASTNPKGIFNTNFKPLPVDLSLVKPALKSKNVDLQIDLLQPVVIDLSQSPEIRVTEKSVDFAPPPIENGFRPVQTKYSQQIGQQIVPNTYLSSKKPITTPGLRNYASSNYLPANSGSKQQNYRVPTKSGPIQFPRHADKSFHSKSKNVRPQVSSNRRVKVAKYTTYYARK